jgi:ubiquinol-cytochrome c reductase iron-sulfur subunit
VSRLRDWAIAAAVLAVGRVRRDPRPGRARLVPDGPPDRAAERLVLLLFALASLCAVGFIVVYAVESIPDQTQYLGLSLGLSFLLVAAALVVTARRLVVTEELAEEYPPPEQPYAQEQVERLVEEAGDRLTRRRLFKLGLLGASGTLGLALLTPALSLGPFFQTKYFLGTPWRRGRRLVDETGRPWRASDIEQDDFYTAFPEGADKEELGSSLVLVRLPVSELRLPPALRGFDAGGIVAYSKICTHAGCAIAMYRAPLFQPAEPRPALVCPCHYSTFDPASGGTVLFGPAGRALPMLPIEVDAKGFLRAKGNFDGQVGPTWWGTHIWRPNP